MNSHPPTRTPGASPAPTRRTAVRYTGRVQGVGFRATARHTARDFPVTGLVRNEPDGSVHLEAQGPPEHLRAFLDALQHRLRAHIDHAHERDQPTDPNETTFTITA